MTASKETCAITAIDQCYQLPRCSRKQMIAKITRKGTCMIAANQWYWSQWCFARANNHNNQWQWGLPARKQEINNNQLACYCCCVFCSERTSAPATQRFCLSLEGTRQLTWFIVWQSPGHGEKVKTINQIGFLLYSWLWYTTTLWKGQSLSHNMLIPIMLDAWAQFLERSNIVT